MHLQIKIDRVYGRVVCYPVNDQAKRLADIAGTKTLLPSVLAIAKGTWGAEIEVIGPQAADLGF